MNNKQVGQFIRQLRKEKGMTQYDLADKLMVPRPSISKWERGTMRVTSKYLVLLSELFDVTTDELVAGERRKRSLADKVNEATLKMVDNNKKLHRILKYAIAIISLLVVFFLVYYFQTFYNSVKIYTIYLDSDKYAVKYGQLLKTRDKIYFYLDIDYPEDEIENIESVQLFYLERNRVVTLGEIADYEPFIFTASNGYDEFIDFDFFDEALNRMYLTVNFNDGDYEGVKVKFKRDYVNSKVLLKRDKDINGEPTTKHRSSESTKVYDRFLQVKEIIGKHGNDNMMDFKFEGKMYHIEITDNEMISTATRNNVKYELRYSYYNKEIFIYYTIVNDMEKIKYSFDIQRGKCLEGDCTNHMDNYRELIRLINEIIYEY